MQSNPLFATRDSAARLLSHEDVTNLMAPPDDAAWEIIRASYGALVEQVAVLTKEAQSLKRQAQTAAPVATAPALSARAPSRARKQFSQSVGSEVVNPLGAVSLPPPSGSSNV